MNPPMKTRLIPTIIYLSMVCLLISCQRASVENKQLEDPDLFREAVQNLTDISVYDIFSPPVAYRVYVYPSIAAYEIMASAFPEQYHSLAGQLKGLTKSPKITEHVNPYLAVIYAYNIVGKTLIFSEDKMTDFQQQFEEHVKNLSVSRWVRKNSKKYAERMSAHILE